jgi:integrase
LKCQHISFEARTLTVEHGKGKKTATIFPPPEFFDAAREWLALRGGKEIQTDYLFAYDKKRRIAYNGLLSLASELPSREEADE